MSNPNTVDIEESNEKTHWMNYDNKTFVAQDGILDEVLRTQGYGYRKVHYTDEVEKNKNLFGIGADSIFFDDEWDIRNTQDLRALDPNNPEKVILRRLGHLYPTNPQLRPKFFPENDYNQPLKKVQDVRAIPHFLHELGLFPASEYKSLFFTQDFQPSGMYHAVVNYNGRWQTDVVDDLIPIYEKSGKPLWGMDLEQPWQIILLKFWAKRNFVLCKDYGYDIATKGGYMGVKNSAAFEFVNYFSNSNWKFINLKIDGEKFLRNNVNKVHLGHFVLKTKTANQVSDAGLIPGEACYQLVNLVEESQAKNTESGIRNPGASKIPNQKAKYIATIRSSNKTYWAGKNSVLDNQFKSVLKTVITQHKEAERTIQQQTATDKRNESFGLDRYFTLEGSDLINLFSTCYITTRRIGTDNVAGYWKFTYPANRTNAIYLEFNVEKETFLDFSIKQLPSNKVAPSNKSKLKAEKYQKQHGGKGEAVERYLVNKYILVKDNARSDTTPSQEQMQKDYKRLNYETYEIEYLKGYNNGDAHFLKAVKGRYILRLKSEVIPRDAHYVINYCANHQLNFKEIQPDRQEETKIMKNAMASLIDRIPRFNLRQGNEEQTIAYGDTFNYVGYGFVGAKLKKTSNLEVLIEVDPEQLKKDGYRLKHMYKNQTEPFAMIVKPGESTAVVLKKINDDEDYIWPPRGISVFQK